MGLSVFLNERKSMFSWLNFCQVAISLLQEDSRGDSRLLGMLSSPTCPAKNVDEVGRPLPNSSIIREHPDPANLRRVFGLRRDLAKETGYLDYVDYANSFLAFLDDNSPFTATNPLFFVVIRTDCGSYEYLYAPALGKAVVAATSKFEQQHNH